MEINCLDIVRCPTCRSELLSEYDELTCKKCDISYPISGNQLDLRLRRSCTKSLEFTFDGDYLQETDFEISLERNPSPDVDWSYTEVPRHLDKDLLSHFPKAESPNARALDLGCGDGVHKDICERAGFNWVGLDISSEQAPILGDAHALPFADSSFDFVISIAVLTHVENPFIMLNEINRVLKPGTTLIGSVGFLEPLNGNSHYHHSPLGTLSSLRQAGFTVTQVGSGWHCLRAIGYKLFPLIPEQALSALIWPLYYLHVLWYGIGGVIYNEHSASETYRKSGLAGSFKFVARKDII